MSKYQKAKEKTRKEAIQWQMDTFAAGQSISLRELAVAQARFERLGRRYGLLREFRENAIC